MGQKQAMVCKLSVFMVSARLLVVIAVATPPWGVASDSALRRPVEDMYNEVSATHPELKPIPAHWLAEERNLRQEEIALRDLTPLEEQFDGSLLCDEDVQALNSLASTLFPVGLTEAVAMAAFGLLHTTPHLYRMMWVCESRMYVNVVAVFHAMVSHVAVQLLQRMIKYDAESSAGLDIKLSLSKPQCITFRSHKKPGPAGVLERCSGDPSELPKQLQPSHEPSIEPDTHSENQARLASSGGSSVQQVDAMLVFSSPRSLVLPSTAQRLRVRQLQSHDLEMRSLSRMLGSSLHVVPAAEWPLDLELALDRVGSSRVLVLSGHFINDKFVFENEKRDGVLVSGKQFVETLVRQLRAEVPELILLNGCMSCGFGREILDELNQRVELDHDVFVVGCVTKLQD